LDGRIVRSSSFSGGILWAPIPGQKLVDALGQMIWQSREHVGEPGLGSTLLSFAVAISV
jgi:hypothetical protein